MSYWLIRLLTLQEGRRISLRAGEAITRGHLGMTMRNPNGDIGKAS